MAVSCPHCSGAIKEASARFCPNCGGFLGASACPACNGPVQAGDRFCNNCGASLLGRGPAPASRGGAGVPSGNLPWYLSGALLLVLVTFLLVSALGDQGPARPPVPAPGGGLGPGVTDISQMTPRDAADRLFNRVMGAAEAGDTAEVSRFLPMAVQAYGMVPDLDHDGLYHQALLQNTGGDYAGALATAQQVLEARPTHILALSAAAQAAIGMGDTAAARGFYQTLVDNYDSESAQTLDEYLAHGNMLGTIQESARTFLGSS